LPSGGNATITNNQIEQGPHTQNPATIAYGEEGLLYSSNTIAITSNMLVNDDPGGTFLLNPTQIPVKFSNNNIFGLSQSLLPIGNNNVLLDTRPTLDLSHLVFTDPVIPPPIHGHGHGHGHNHLMMPIISDHQ
jgi:hypothetical protein